MLLLQGHSGSVQSLAYAPDGSLLASGGLDRTVRLWDPATGREQALLAAGTPVFCVAFAPDGKTLAAGGLDENVTLWDPATRHQRATLVGHTSGLTGLAFSPDGGILASGAGNLVGFSNRGEAVLWDLAWGRELTRLTSQRLGHVLQSYWEGFYYVGGILSLAYGPDGRDLVLGTGSNVLLWWDTAADVERRIVDQERRVLALAFAPDGRTLASAAGYDVKLWDAATGEERARLVGHQGKVLTVAFAPDGRTLASGGMDGTVVLWDAASGRRRAAFNWRVREVTCVAFAPGGMTAAAAGRNGNIVVWDVDDLPAA